jgi:photosystem II stability/assembly factor-like uncharacterized protein
VSDPVFDRKRHLREEANPRAGYPDAAMRWYIEQRAIPAGVIPADWRDRALEHIARENRPSDAQGLLALSWTPTGPDNIGGRVRAIAVHPSNPSLLYAASVSGGIFRTTNGGSSWTPLTDAAANLAVTALAVDPVNPSILYAGTGEGFFNGDAIRGAGVLKSTDAGATWTLLTSFTGGGGFPYYINDLYQRPDSTSILYAASNTGLFRTTNAGATWSFLHQGAASMRATQIARAASQPRTFYVSYGNFSTDGIYKTTNGGASFTKLTTGLPSTGYTRISLAVAPSSPQTLYAALNSTNNTTRGIFRSTTGGASWDSVAVPVDGLTGSTHLAGQGWYNNVIAADPANPAVVYAGGVNLYKSTNSGLSWTMLSNWYPGAGYPYVHADQHALIFNGSSLVIGNDGGVFRTTDGGISFSELNNGFATIQFYAGAVHPTLDVFYGGTQDNGTLRSGTVPAWSMVLGGDGGSVEVHPLTPSIVYTEYVYLNIQRSTDGGTTWTKWMNGIPTTGGGQFNGTSDRCQFIAPYVMHPTRPNRLAAGTYRVFLTSNGGSSWSPVSGDLTGDGTGAGGSTITAVAFAPSDTTVIWVGTSGSSASARVQVTTNSGATWTNVTGSPLPNRTITRIIVDPASSSRAWVLASGYASNTPATPGHVFFTSNRGASWSNSSGNLPDLPVSAGIVNPANPNHVVVGTDLGIFETTNGGTSWQQQNTGLANVSVSDLDLRAADNVLFAATHGRGMYRTTGPLTAVRTTGEEVPFTAELRQNYPNPFNPTTTVPFTVPAQGRVRLSVVDLLGRTVAVLVDEDLVAGSYTARWNADGAASGTYLARLETAGASRAIKLTLLR